MNSDRQFWGNRPRKRQPKQGSMTMKLIQMPTASDECDDCECGASQRFELVLGAVRIELTASELLRMRTLISRGAQMYKDSLTQDL
ncbi:MAG: hypothetical protein CMJ19_08530 [Phycisphaeraceae bacterium]|nr:hypothetical protein [Phycisphaeraceae bacterium]